ncbi:uncharacterized protein LOC117652663 [Thrips palmi]|uniref:Uncharacterized protein LOC117652663 n=1 Tax=Thrips palmi TaxID=161013 RepID=A0A6P9ACL5_THRPL|nr:uncharacterized protein LOC117652663 [Thrips palmi]
MFRTFFSWENPHSDSKRQEYSTKKEHFQRAVKKLVGVFTSEKESTYYVPPCPENNQPFPRGLVANAYRNTKSRKHSLNPEASSQPKGVKRSRQKHLPSICYAPRNESEVLGATEFLAHSISPWPEVKKAWDITAPSRLSSLFSEESASKSKKKNSKEQPLLLCTYMSAWPVLKHASGTELILQDFNHLYPGHELTLYSAWEQFCTSVLRCAPKHVTDSYGRGLLTELKGDLRKGHRDVLIACLLPSLVQPTARVPKPGQGVWKPSIAESREAFVLHVKTVADVDTALKVREAKLLRLGVRSQPLLVIVGELKDIRNFVVVIDNNRYSVTGFLQSVDTLFKSFFALSTDYPVEAKQIWMLIQKSIYKISSSCEEKIPTVETVLNEFHV